MILLCSDGLISYIGKDEILEASQADTPEIVANLLAYGKKQESPADLSAIAIKIYDEEYSDSRPPAGTHPEDTDLNKETRDLALIANRVRESGRGRHSSCLTAETAALDTRSIDLCY